MLMMHLLEWANHNPLAATTIGLLGLGTCAALYQGYAARSQASTARSGLEIAERAAIAAEKQLELSRAETSHANAEKDLAKERAQMAEERASLAHEQMKAALKPMLVLLRVQDSVGQKFFLENQGTGFAEEITWDHLPTGSYLAKGELNPSRLVYGFVVNTLAPKSREEFRFSYDSFELAGILFRYKSADGRYFDTHISMPNNNGAFRHIHSSIAS